MSGIRPDSVGPIGVSTSWNRSKPEMQPVPADASAPGPLLPCAVLVADASSAEREAIAAIVRQKHPSVTVVEAEDGPAALDALTAHAIGVALCDRCLPGLDGSEFLRRIRECERSTVLALLSDRLVPQWAKVARSVGVYDFILKPIGPEQFDRLLAAFARICAPTNLLLVESSPKILDLVAAMLRQSRFRLNLDLSGTAKDALRILVPEFYDLALVNVALPDASGVETAFQVLARSPATRVVTYGSHESFSPTMLRRLGAAAHLPTPFAFHDLELALHEALGLWQPYALKALNQIERLDQTGVDFLFRQGQAAAGGSLGA